MDANLCPNWLAYMLAIMAGGFALAWLISCCRRDCYWSDQYTQQNETVFQVTAQRDKLQKDLPAVEQQRDNAWRRIKELEGQLAGRDQAIENFTEGHAKLALELVKAQRQNEDIVGAIRQLSRLAEAWTPKPACDHSACDGTCRAARVGGT